MSDFTDIKNILKKILENKNTLTFLDKITWPIGDETERGLTLVGVEIVNCFLHNIFYKKHENIYVNDIFNNRKISDLVINGKRISIKSISSNNNKFFFKTVFCDIKDEIILKRNLELVKNKLNIYDYFLIIIFDRRIRNNKFGIKYDFYLLPSSYFAINDSNFKISTTCATGTNWIVRTKKDFSFFINYNDLPNPIFSYSINYE